MRTVVVPNSATRRVPQPGECRSLRNHSATMTGATASGGLISGAGLCQAVPVGTGTERDRDESGRPHNTRPRDALGRPLPYGTAGVPRVPEDLLLAPAESLAYAQDLLDRGQPFNAHEVLESAWKTGPEAERPLWQGLAQLAVGVTHVRRGNLAGGAALLRRASSRLSEAAPAPYGIDTSGLIAQADALAGDLEAGHEPSPDRLRIRLTGTG